MKAEIKRRIEVRENNLRRWNSVTVFDNPLSRMMRNAKNNHKSIGVRAQKLSKHFILVLDSQRLTTKAPAECTGTCVLFVLERSWNSDTQVSQIFFIFRVIEISGVNPSKSN